MQPSRKTGAYRTLRAMGSLWFAAVLLVLLLVAMACATVYESVHGTERALIVFYRSWWFELLLALLAINVGVAMVVRFPFSRRQIGFVITHTSILVTLAGALVTKHLGVDGQVGIVEGQTIDHFGVAIPTLMIRNRSNDTRSTIDLDAKVFGGFRAVSEAARRSSDLVRVNVERYLPDSRVSKWEETGGMVKIDFKGSTFEIPLEDCTGKEVLFGETGYTVRVLRYLPHATVGPDNKLVNMSNRPENPAIELELNGPDGPEKRFAFARFPDFASMHGGEHKKDLKVTFVAPTSSATTIEPVEPVRETRIPAVLVKVSTDDHTSGMWLQKYQPRTKIIGDKSYELVFRDKQIPLGFELALNRFRIGYYPGGMRPRSFESHITIVDPATGRAQSRVISMNNPTAHGGYTFYQSSYRQTEARAISFLSVSRDPGQPIVFTGYIAMMTGMVVILVTRIADRRRVIGKSTAGGGLVHDRIEDTALSGESPQSATDTVADTGSGIRHRDDEPVVAPQQ